MPRKAKGAASRLAKAAAKHIDIADIKKASRHADAPSTPHPKKPTSSKPDAPTTPKPDNHGYDRKAGTAPTGPAPQPGTFTQSKGNGTRLGNNMARDYPDLERPEQTAAHHMVPGNSTQKNAQRARDVLTRLGIDVNDAGNGVYLPRNSNVPDTARIPPTAMTHSTIHTDKYYEAIYNRLKLATSREKAYEILDIIRQEILEGKFPR